MANFFPGQAETQIMKATTAVTRMAAIAAALLCIGANPALAAGTTSKPSAVTLRVVVPAIVRAAGLTHPQRLEIGANDVSRGYVELDGATTLLLTSNSRAGYSLSASFDPSLLSRVVVSIQEQTLAFTGAHGRGAVNASRMSDAPVQVSYRLYLQAGAVPGTYRWPVALTFGQPA